MRETDSVAVYFVYPMTHALREQPARLHAVLEQAGIEPALMDQPAARVPATAFAALWLTQIRELNDEFFQLDSHGMPPGSFALICRALIQESTLEKAMRQCLVNFGLFLRDFRGTLTVRGKRAVIGLQTQAQSVEQARYGEETFMVLMISLLCWLGGRRVPIDRADFRHERLSLSDDSLLWGANLTLGAERTEIEFDSRFLQLPVVQDLASLKAFLRSAPQWLVIRFRNQQGVAAQLYHRLRTSHYGEWPTLDAFAVEQHLSPSTVRRKLEREGCSFQQIKDEVRRAVAFEQLRQTRTSITRIAEQIGFQEPSAFHRAFKKWTGESPGQYRLRLQGRRSAPVPSPGSR